MQSVWKQFSASRPFVQLVHVRFPKYVEDYLKRKESSSLTKFLAHPVVSTVIGATTAITGGFISTYWIEMQEREQKEKEDRELYLTRCESLKKHILSADRSLIHSRESFVRGLGKDVVHVALQKSRRDAQKALEIYDEFSTVQQEEFSKERGYNNQSLLHLISHIDYHIGSLLLKEFDCTNAKLELARSLAIRITISDHVQHVKNEIYRSKIKIADALSQSRELSIALRLYDDIAAPMKQSDLLSTFWKARALNNKAIVHFAIGRDQQALDGMKKTGEIVSEFLNKLNVVAENPGDVIADIQRLKNRISFNIKCPDTPPCQQFCDLVSMGAVGVVDILHLPHIKELIEDDEKTRKNLAFVFDGYHVAVFASECLERIRLIARKQCTAAANSVIIQSCPYSDINQSSVCLVDLMNKIFELPCNDALYKELDGEWVHQEGSVRILSAICSGMITLLDTELQKPGETSMKTVEWISFLEQLTESLVKKSDSYVNKVPDIHRAFAHFVRARFLILLGKKDDAIEELARIREWTLLEQGVAKKNLKRLQADGVMWPQSGVPPRHSRLQVTSLLMFMSLQPKGYSQDDKEALEFAFESLHMESHTHSLSKAANAVKNTPGSDCSWFLKFPRKTSQSASACTASGMSVQKEECSINYGKLLSDAKASAKKWEHMSELNSEADM